MSREGWSASDSIVPSPSGSSSGGSSPPRSVPAISSSPLLLLGDEARLHAEVDGLRVVGDDRHRRLLGLDRVAVGEGHADLLEAEQAPDLLVLGLVRAGGIAPRVAATLVGVDAELAADLGVQPLGHALGRLDAEAVDEELLGELAILLELLDQSVTSGPTVTPCSATTSRSPPRRAAGRSRRGRSGRAWAGAGRRAARARGRGRRGRRRPARCRRRCRGSSRAWPAGCR